MKAYATLAQLHARCQPAPTGCIIYRGRGGNIAHRYGVVKTIFGKMTVSRAVKSLELGQPVDQQLEACHTCDNPRCANPAHIFVASHAGNMEDKRQKGRWRKGNTVRRETVLEILKRRANGEVIASIANSLGLHEVSVGYICTGKRHRQLWEQFHATPTP